MRRIGARNRRRRFQQVPVSGGGLDFWIVCRRLYVAATDYVVWAVEQLRDSASHALTQSGCPVNGPCYVLQAFTAGCEAKNI